MAQTDSTIVTASLLLQGTWLHDPKDPEGTVRQYLFGGDGRTDQPDAGATELQFVGRAFPVYEFGDPQTDQVHTTVQIPHGPDYATQLAGIRAIPRSKRVWCYRDNRGRALFGRVSAQDTDQQYGSSVAVTVDRADFDEAV